MKKKIVVFTGMIVIAAAALAASGQKLPQGQPFVLLLSAGAIGHLKAAGTDTWTATGTMTSSRFYHTSTLLPSGHVLVAGGSNSTTLSSAELYDPISNTWSPTGSMSTPRSSASATLLGNGLVLVAGGVNLTGTLATAELYDYTTGLWTVTGSMPNVHMEHNANLLPDGRVLIAGGMNVLPGCCYFSYGMTESEIYDPVSGNWSSTGPMNNGRVFHSAASLANGTVLVAGGSSSGGDLASAEIYDPAAGTWSFTSSLAGTRHAATATRLPNGKVMLVGGYAPFPSATVTAEVYDPVLGTWSFTGSSVAGRSLHTATAMAAGKVLVTGGFMSYPVISPDTEMYEVASGTWSSSAGMSTGRVSASATLLSDGRVLVAGGYSDIYGVFLDSAEVYDAHDTPEEAIQNLLDLITGLGLPAKAEGSLTAPLSNINTNNINASCGKLNAFINQVNAKTPPLTAAQAAQLIQSAKSIKTSLECPGT